MRGIDCIGRWGLKIDPTGSHILGPNGRLYDCIGVERCEVRSVWMLRVRHFNGEPAADLSLSACEILERGLFRDNDAPEIGPEGN